MSRYFYLCMSLLLAARVMSGFSRTVNANLFHADPPRPWLLWVHGVVFSTWIVFFLTQSALVRARVGSVRRLLGWFVAGLATVMPWRLLEPTVPGGAVYQAGNSKL